MNNESIKSALNAYVNYSSQLQVDESTVTWQVSFVWLASGDRKKFRAIENFYLYAVLKKSPFSSGHVNELDWCDYVDLGKWVDGLSISLKSSDQIAYEVRDALDEVLKNEQDEDFVVDNFKVTGKVLKAWCIEETWEPRFAVGSHWGYLFETESSFYYLERNWES